VGGNCGVYEGTQVLSGAVLGAGVILTRATPVYDIVREQIYRSTADQPLVIPENAVVVPGSRAIGKEKPRSGGFHSTRRFIVKYRDEKPRAQLSWRTCCADGKTQNPKLTESRPLSYRIPGACWGCVCAVGHQSLTPAQRSIPMFSRARAG